MPNFNTISIYVGEKVKDYLSKAGTTIFVASIIVWIVLNFGSHGMVSDMSQSFGATFGRFLVPILAPAGLGLWQIAVMLISGLAAKEVVVSSFLVLFGISSLTAPGAAEGVVSMMGAMGFGPLNAYALMIFTLLYTPCLATVATIKRETNSWKWTIGFVLFQLVIAWICAVLVFQVGSFFLA
jgi:ferrous iron transport protein B